MYVRIRDTEWNVYRRYSQFFDLHQSLRKKDPIVNSFDFPPKKTVGNMGERFVEDRRRALQSYLRCIVNYLVRLVLDIFEASDSLVRLARLVFDIFEAIYFLVRVVFDIFEASKWLLSGDHQRGTVYVPRQSNSSHVSSLLCGCSRQFQQVRSLVKNNPTPAIADNIDTCSNGQAPSLSIFSRRRRSENSQTNQLPNPVL